ncbi:MAG: tetratricopeptide repeat protein [Elusimicrobia bacterium]|nr:tetratricopeptide repeat protein [Elusimicrobiota bacterium]
MGMTAAMVLSAALILVPVSSRGAAPSGLDAEGIALLLQGDYAGALKKFDASIARHPKNAQALANRCTARYKLGDMDGSIADFKSAVALKRTLKGEISAQISDAYYRRALWLAEKGERAKAALDLYDSVRLNRRNPRAYAKIGELAILNAEFRTAVDYFDRALKLDKNLDAALAGRARALLELGKTRQALADVDTAILLRPSEAAYFELRAEAHKTLGRADQAAKDERWAHELRKK